MDDQKRLFTTIAVLMVILLGWQWLIKETRPPVPPEEAAPATAPATAPTTPTPGTVEQAPAGAAPAPGEAAAPAGAAAPEQSAKFATPLFEGTLSTSGALTRLVLRDYKEDRDGDDEQEPVSLVTPIDGAERQARFVVDLGGGGAAWELAEGGPERYVLRAAAASGARATLTVAPRPDQYALDYTLVVENGGAAAVTPTATVSMALAPNPGAGEGSFFTPPADTVNGFCALEDDVERFSSGGIEQPEQRSGIQWAGIDRQYFVVALVPQDGAGECRVRGKDKAVFVDYALSLGAVAPGARAEKRFVAYLGPKRSSELSAVAPILENIIDYNIWKIPLGFLARPMVWVMNFFHGWTGSWGMAIILLTFLVKAILFPVTYKSVVSMRRMQLLKPELDKLKARLGNDRERMQVEQMKLFREKGVNPLGGCLPMLLQMPVWFALYRMLWTSVDLYQQSFLWLGDLTAKESFPFLSIAFGALTMLQQKLTPTTMDSQQAKIMLYVMPAMFTLFMIGLPSGLVLYIVVNSILTIIQQLVINRRQVTL